jgi:hypothetical protein
MHTNMYCWSYLPQFFLEWEMFQTNVVEKIKTHILCSITCFFFLQNPAIYEIKWKNFIELGRPQMTIWNMCIACWIPKATNTYLEYVIPVVFPLQQWLHKNALVLRYSTWPVFFMLMSNTLLITVCVHDLYFKSSMILSFGSSTAFTLGSQNKKKTSCSYCIRYVWYTYFFNNFFHTFLTNFDPWTQLKTESCFSSRFSFLIQLNRVKYPKYMRTGMYCLEEKSERNLCFSGSWQLPRFIWAVLTDRLLPTHSEHWQNSQSVLLSLAVGQTKHLPRRLSPFFFTVIGEAVCLQGTSLAFAALQLCLLTFPLSALL